ncbi:peptidoglycan-binding protein [Spongiibacter taiwanensis]|uniref:peptidoglycan-binding protein n=1 Tax=Spongiibacter taiwanensis TaxID=1748242 RepID=UPI00203601CF|nr:peptidoglycan-binding protein [Spongiibacter taiwanensis]USA42843.1 peptidoglycan-binding protein [Spongiibacter taiwanensis]
MSADLKLGCRGDEVARLQAHLCLAGFDAHPIDGHFGPTTEAALIACQRFFGLLPNGEASDELLTQIGVTGPDLSCQFHPICHQIDVDFVAAIFPESTPRKNIEANLPEILLAIKYGAMDDRDLVLMALATIRAESETFEPVSEAVSKYNTSPNGRPFDLYDYRSDLGNIGPPDGANYRGRGFIQLTGRANYQHFSLQQGLEDRLLAHPEWANHPRLAARLLVAYIQSKQARIKYALIGNDLASARRLINGGSHGLARFIDTFEKGKQRLT